MGRLAWLKVIAQNRRTIFKLVKEAFFGKARLPRNPDREVPCKDAVQPEVAGELRGNCASPWRRIARDVAIFRDS
jgi:hypothetical protein